MSLQRRFSIISTMLMKLLRRRIKCLMMMIEESEFSRFMWRVGICVISVWYCPQTICMHVDGGTQCITQIAAVCKTICSTELRGCSLSSRIHGSCSSDLDLLESTSNLHETANNRINTRKKRQRNKQRFFVFYNNNVEECLPYCKNRWANLATNCVCGSSQ